MSLPYYHRFTRHYRAAFYLRDLLWIGHIRRVEWLGRLAGSGRLPITGAIPGFGPVNCS